MRLLMLIVIGLISISQAHARPNYSGVYKGTIIYQINEAVGFDKGIEPTPYRFRIADKGSYLVFTNLSTSDKGVTSTFLSKGFIVVGTQTLHFAPSVTCEAVDRIQVTKIKDGTARLKYSKNVECDDGTYIQRVATIPLKRKT